MFCEFLQLITKLDQTVAFMSYNQDAHFFYGYYSQICDLVYRIVPYLVLFILILPVILLFTKKYSSRELLRLTLINYLSLFMSVGLIINLTFKPYWGRPRPRDFTSNISNYRDFWQINWHRSEIENSFPSGHASVGFFLGLPFYSLTRQKKYLILSCVSGGGIGLVRILQGGHYVTDVLFAGIIVFAVHYIIMILVDKFFKVSN